MVRIAQINQLSGGTDISVTEGRNACRQAQPEVEKGRESV